jgi:cob(I)alamin adenosyltransferase
MGHRLSKIITRTGDDGTTGLADGSRVSKDSARIEALGAIDELNSLIGVLVAEGLPADIADELTDVQHDLFDCGGEMAIPGYVAVTEQQVDRIEGAVEAHNAGLSALKEFILPGGTRAAALAHLARTVARRAERTVVHLATGAGAPAGDAAATSAINPITRRYLNRLSDYLFVIARVCNQRSSHGDVLWKKGKNR